MRVITGKYKGRKLIAPKSETRPTLDRTKETLFNILSHNLTSARVLDLFAGSGQIAIECLSRGAARAVLCDNSRDAAAAIKANFEKIGETPQLYFGNYLDCLRNLNEQFDFIFIDPPYKSDFYCKALEMICDRNLLSANGIVVCEHARDVVLKNTDRLEIYDVRKIGSVQFSFYKRSGAICE